MFFNSLARCHYSMTALPSILSVLCGVLKDKHVLSFQFYFAHYNIITSIIATIIYAIIISLASALIDMLSVPFRNH